MNDQKNYLFTGDSITEWFDTANLLTEFNIKNRGVAGDSSLELLERIEEEWFQPTPDYIFLCIGTNDLARRRSPKEILGNVENICEEILEYSPLSTIVLTSVFPVRNNPDRVVSDILKLNELLKGVTRIGGYHYFNLYPHFTDSTGILKDEYTEDGLHLTAAAYLKWSELFKEFLKEIGA